MYTNKKINLNSYQYEDSGSDALLIAEWDSDSNASIIEEILLWTTK